MSSYQTLKRISYRICKNLLFSITRDFSKEFENTKIQLKKTNNQLNKEIDQLRSENDFLLRTCFDEDPWLAKAKDIHKGERCFLLGCGPSLNKIDLSKLKNELTMGVNGTFLIDDLDLDYFVSVSFIFWKHHKEQLKNFRCKRRFFPPHLKELESDCPTSWLRTIELKDHERVENKTPWFFSTTPHKYVVLGGTVICTCLQLLYHMGVSEVVLLGIDHDYGVKKEDFGETGKGFVHADNLNAHFMPGYYNKGGEVHIDIAGAERSYELAKESFEADGRTILNASPGTKLLTFQTVGFDSLF